ncbi:MAG: amidohydrolase family protein, partial [Cytophagaceae bacterium]|nr:amidohydrolase family protein [Gemmatimonadaceae bacterium]
NTMKRVLPLVLVTIVIVCPVSAQERRSTEADRATTIAFARVGVVDVEGGRVLTDQTVIVREGRIAALGSSQEVPVPAGASVVDGKGHFLVPGFADMHVHLYTEGDVMTYVANGVTTVRNMAGDSTHLEFRRRVSAGDMIGPRILTAGPVIETGSLSHPDNVLLTDHASARREVERQRAAGYDFIKVYNQMSPEVYASVIAAAKEFNMSVVGHVPFEVGLRGALAARQNSIEHLRGYLQELVPPAAPVQPRASLRNLSVAWNYADDSRSSALVALTVAAGTWNSPTLVFSVHEMSPASEHARLLARSETKLLSLRGLPDRSKKEGYLGDFTEADFAATQRGLEAQFRLLRALDKAGAGLLVGTDSWLSGFAYADELELLVKAGLTPARVLRMATVDAARFLGEADQWGTIAVGRRADLVLLDANPLRDIANARRIRAVVSNGRLLRRADLDTLLGIARSKAR